MAFELARALTAVPANAEIKRGRFVSLATADGTGSNAPSEDAGWAAGEFVQTGSTYPVPIGVALEDSAAGSKTAISIATLDGSRLEIEAGAGISPAGSAVSVDSQGRVIKAAGSNPVIGYIEAAVSASGDLATVLIAPKFANFA